MTTTATATASRTSLADVRRVVGAWCEQADPALHAGADATGVVEELAVLIRRLTAKQAGFAARVEECHSHAKRFASSEDFLAKVNGTSRGDAKQAIDTARRLKACPTARAAFDRGELSVGEASAIAGAVALDPSAEGELVTTATTTHDLVEVRQRADKVKAAARNREDPAARRARLRARRRWSEFDDDEMKAVAVRWLPEDWTRVAPVVDAFTGAVFDRARKQGAREPMEAYRADAVLAALAAAGETIGLDVTHPTTTNNANPPTQPATATTPATTTAATTTAAPPAESDDPSRKTSGQETGDDLDADGALAALLKVRPDRVKWNLILMVDAIALQRGYATAAETCEVVGLGPISVDLAREILPEALVDVLVHDLVDIRAHATMTRHQRKALKASLRARDRRCVVPGCRRRRRLQADHRHDFAKQGPTAYQNMELLCEVHHREKTHHGARLERVGDEWHWYPPPPEPGQPQPPPGSIPWRAKVGEHLTPFDLSELPPPPIGPDADRPLPGDTGDTLPFP